MERDYETNGVQMVRDANGVTHIIAAPTLVDAGHARVLYGECAQDCGAPASWSYGNIADGFTADKIRIALAADGTVHVALLEDTQVTFGSCSAHCADTSAWTFRPVTAPAEQVWQYMPKGRPFAVSAAGLPRLLVNERSNGSTAVLLIAQSDDGFSADPLLSSA